MDERRKPAWPFWMAFSLIALPVLYGLSTGPVAMLCQAGVIDDDAMISYSVPLVLVLRHCPDRVVLPYAEYLALWGGSL